MFLDHSCWKVIFFFAGWRKDEEVTTKRVTDRGRRGSIPIFFHAWISISWGWRDFPVFCFPVTTSSDRPLTTPRLVWDGALFVNIPRRNGRSVGSRLEALASFEAGTGHAGFVAGVSFRLGDSLLLLLEVVPGERGQHEDWNVTRIVAKLQYRCFLPDFWIFWYHPACFFWNCFGWLSDYEVLFHSLFGCLPERSSNNNEWLECVTAWCRLLCNQLSSVWCRLTVYVMGLVLLGVCVNVCVVCVCSHFDKQCNWLGPRSNRQGIRVYRSLSCAGMRYTTQSIVVFLRVSSVCCHRFEGGKGIIRCSQTRIRRARLKYLLLMWGERQREREQPAV